MKTRNILPALLGLGLLTCSAPTVRAQSVGVTGAAPVRPVAADMTDEQIKALGQGVAFPYEILSRVLGRVVNKGGQVDYGQTQNSDELALYVRAVGLADMKNFPVFDEKDENGAPILDQRQPTAFYINAYNAIFLQTVAQAYPVSGVAEIRDLYSKKRPVAGEQISLDELRKKIIALDYRAVFVLMDGTQMGPRAVNGALFAFNLDSELNAGISSYVNDPVRVTTPSRLTNEVVVSPWLLTVDDYFQPNKRRRKGDGIKRILSGYTTDKANQRYYGAAAYTIEYLPAQNNLNQPSNGFDALGQGGLAAG